MLVKDVMVKEVVTLKPEDTIREASKKFAENKVIEKNNRIYVL